MLSTQHTIAKAESSSEGSKLKTLAHNSSSLFQIFIPVAKIDFNLMGSVPLICRNEGCNPCLPQNPSASRIDPAEDVPIECDYGDADFSISSLKWKMKHPGGDKKHETVSDNETGDDDTSEEEDFDDVQESGIMHNMFSESIQA